MAYCPRTLLASLGLSALSIIGDGGGKPRPEVTSTMSEQAETTEQTPQLKGRKPALFAFVTLCVSAVLVLKTPSFWAIFIPEFGRLLQYLMSMHLQATPTLRSQAELFQTLASQTAAGGEWSSLGIGSRHFPFEMKIRNVVMVAIGNISVIIPTLNEEKYLLTCLKSLTRQLQKERAETIVVDGGSSDRTVEIAKDYADNVLVEPALWVGASRNLGAKHATGEILAFIDADTMACDDWLAVIGQTFDSDPEAVGMTGPTLPFEGTYLDRLAYHVATGSAQRLSLKLGRPHVAGFNCAYRKVAFWNAGGFDEDRVLSEDVMLSLRMRHQGRILFNPDMVAHTSLRRIKKYGYPYLTMYYAINAAMMLLFNRTLGYPQVR
jgi:hypothetical protein